MHSQAEHKPSFRAQLLMWGGAVMFVFIVVAMIIGAPLALAHGYPAIGMVIYKGFRPLCHQISERSFHIEGHAFAVCARCTGIYFGFAAGVVLYPLVGSFGRTHTPGRKWLLLAALPISIDWALGFFGLWENTHLSRLLTGALLGTVCALYVVPGLMDVLQTDWRRFFTNTSPEARQRPVTTLPISRDDKAPSDYGSPASRI